MLDFCFYIYIYVCVCVGVCVRLCVFVCVPVCMCISLSVRLSVFLKSTNRSQSGKLQAGVWRERQTERDRQRECIRRFGACGQHSKGSQ